MTEEMSLRRDAIVVLGTFYSGVGAMRRVLSRSGVSLGSEPPSITFGEDGDASEVAAINARVLNDLDTSWRDPVAPLRSLGDQAISDKHRLLAEETIVRQYGDSDMISFGAPGSPLLLRFWSDALTANGFRLHYVVMVRNPLESAKSLKTDFNVSRNAALLLWANYMVAADLETRDQARLFVRFDDLLAEPDLILDRIEGSFDLKLPRRTWESVGEIESDLDSNQRRHVFSAETRALKPFPQLKELHDYFEATARDQPRNVDATRQAEDWLANLSQTMGPVLAQLGQELRRQETATREARKAAAAARAELETERRDGEARLAVSGETISRLELDRTALNAELEEKARQVQSTRDAAAAMDAELSAARELSALAEARAQELDRARAELQSRLSGAEAQAAGLERELAIARERATELTKLAERREAAIRASQSRLADLKVRAERAASAAKEERLRRAWTLDREDFSAKADAAAAELRQNQARSMELESELVRVCGELEASRQTVDETASIQRQQADELIGAAAELRQSEARLAELASELIRVSAELEASRGAIDDAASIQRQQADELIAAAAKEEDLRRAWTLERENLSARAEAVVADLRQNQARSAELESELIRVNGELEASRRAVNDAAAIQRERSDKIIAGLRAETAASQAALEVALAQSQALARALSEAVAEERGAAWGFLAVPWRLFSRRRA